MGQKNMLHESYDFAPENFEEESTGSFSGILLHYDRFNRNGRLYRQGAFADDDGKTFPMLLNHDIDNIVGKVVIHEGIGQVNVRGFFNLDTSIGAETFSNVKFNAVNNLSVGLLMTDYEVMDEDNFFSDVVVHKGDIVEGSIVAVPADKEAKILLSDSYLSYDSWKERKNNYHQLTDLLEKLRER